MSKVIRKKTMAKNLREGHTFTTSRRGYSTPTLTAVTIDRDEVHNELVVTVRDHLDKPDTLRLRQYQEVVISNFEA